MTLKNAFFLMHEAAQKGKDKSGQGKGQTKNAKEFFKGINRMKSAKKMIINRPDKELIIDGKKYVLPK